jgi:hypothetical protein
MLDWIGDDRRRNNRAGAEVRFRCYLSGKRFQANVANMSSSGAFLALDRVVRPGAPIVMELMRPGQSVRSPALVCEVVHFALKPVMGAGVKWVKAVSEDGLDDLNDFMKDFLGFEIELTEMQRFSSKGDTDQTVGYDFRSGLLTLEKRRTQSGDKIVSMFGIKVSERAMEKLGMADVKVVQTAAPKQKRATLHDPDGTVTLDERAEDTVATAKRLDEWMLLRRQGRSLEVPVVLAFAGRNFNGRTASVSMKGLFVDAAERLPEPGSRVLVRFPVKTAQTVHSVIIVGQVQRTLRGPKGERWGSSLSIVTVNEGENPGIFRRYIETI